MNPSDPNLNPANLLGLAKEFSKEVLKNVSLELISLENPAVYEEIIDLCYRIIAEYTVNDFSVYYGPSSQGHGDGYGDSKGGDGGEDRGGNSGYRCYSEGYCTGSGHGAGNSDSNGGQVLRIWHGIKIKDLE